MNTFTRHEFSTWSSLHKYQCEMKLKFKYPLRSVQQFPDFTPLSGINTTEQNLHKNGQDL